MYLGFYRKAKTIHKLDRPFIYRFVRYIVEDDRNFYIFPLGRLLFREAKQHSPKANASLSSMPPLTGKRLFRAIHLFKPNLGLELGSGDGLSTIYQATAMLSGDVISIEPNPVFAAYAQKLIEELGLPNITLVNDQVEASLRHLFAENIKLDYVFLHHIEAESQFIDYFQRIEAYLHHQSIVILAAPYRSASSLQAWKQLCKHPKVQLSIDLFDLGFLFFDPAFRKKQHYQIVPAYRKFWKLGLFR